MLILCALPASAAVDDAELRLLMENRTGPAKKANANVVGVIDEKGQRILVAGKASEAKAPDGDTVFEIGSITKAFTAILLADMVNKGEVNLDDPVSKYLPAGSRGRAAEGSGGEVRIHQSRGGVAGACAGSPRRGELRRTGDRANSEAIEHVP